MYINKEPNENGYYGNPHSEPNGYLLPDWMLDTYIGAMGFVVVEANESDEITALTVNQEALDVYIADRPTVEPEPVVTVNDIINTLLGGDE